MKQCRIDLVTLLKDAGAVTAIVEDRIYAGLAPLDSAMPFICFERSSTERPRTHDQRDAESRRKADRYQVVLYLVGMDIEVLDTLHDAVDDALDGRAGDGSMLFLFDGASESSEYVADDSGGILYEIQMEFATIRKPVS